MSEAARWQAGIVVVLQEIWRGKLWSARPMTVADDQGDFVALWCPKGTRWKINEPWHDWRPDPSWPVPELPPGWDRLGGAEPEE